MEKIGELYQSADWKKEKHVPVINCPDTVRADEVFEVNASNGGVLLKITPKKKGGKWEE